LLLVCFLATQAIATEPKCRGTKKLYLGKCRYPDDIAELIRKAEEEKANEPEVLSEVDGDRPKKRRKKKVSRPAVPRDSVRPKPKKERKKKVSLPVVTEDVSPARSDGPDPKLPVVKELPVAESIERAGWRVVEPQLIDESPSPIDWVQTGADGLEFAKSETTVAQYRRCVSVGPCTGSHHSTADEDPYCNLGHSGLDYHPMNCVDWIGARAFCQWVGGRLPTEEEWFNEASGQSNWDYPWGDIAPDCSRCVMDDGETIGGAGGETDGCGEDRTWPVCMKPAGNSASGLCDMVGNVWEWTDSQPEEFGGKRIVRGGAWSYEQGDELKVSYRLAYPLSNRSSYVVGFRCVRTAPRTATKFQ